MNDRLTRGAAAGALGGLWVVGWTLVSFYVLHFARATWTDTMSRLVAGHPIRSAGDWVVAVSMVLLFDALLGALYVRFVVPERSGDYLWRAGLFGWAVWFLLMALGTFYKIPPLDWQTALSNWVAVLGWGAVTGWLVERWDRLAEKER